MKINPLATLDDVQPDDIDSGPVVILNLLKFKPGGSLAGVLAEPLPDELRRAIGSHLPPDIDKMEAIARLAVDSALRTLNQKLLAECARVGVNFDHVTDQLWMASFDSDVRRRFVF